MKKISIIIHIIIMLAVFVGCSDGTVADFNKETPQIIDDETYYSFKQCVDTGDYVNASLMYTENIDDEGIITKLDGLIDEKLEAIKENVDNDIIEADDAIALLDDMQKIGSRQEKINGLITICEAVLADAETIENAQGLFDSGDYDSCTDMLASIEVGSKYIDDATELRQKAEQKQSELTLLADVEGNTVANANGNTRFSMFNGKLYYLCVEGESVYLCFEDEKHLVYTASAGNQTVGGGLNVIGDNVYFVAGYLSGFYTPYFDLYHVGLGQMNVSLIQKDVSPKVYVKGDTIYFLDADSLVLYKMPVDGSEKQMLFNGEAWSGFNVVGDSIYIGITESNDIYRQQLHRIDPSGNDMMFNDEEKIGGKFLSFYVSELDESIYYFSNVDYDECAFYFCDLNGENITKLRNINMVTNTIFGEDETYLYFSTGTAVELNFKFAICKYNKNTKDVSILVENAWGWGYIPENGCFYFDIDEICYAYDTKTDTYEVVD